MFAHYKTPAKKYQSGLYQHVFARIPISNLNREQLQFNLLQFFRQRVKSNSSLSMTVALISTDELDLAFI